jgi:hypothetical protein
MKTPTWLTSWFAQPGRGVLRMVARRSFAPGAYENLPTADAVFRGALTRTEGGAGIADTLRFAYKDSGDVYQWLDITTVAATAYGDEQARDAIGTALTAGNNIDIAVDDGLNTITISVETLTLADISDVTASATELNYSTNVTSDIQTQLDGKQPLDGDLTTLAANITAAGHALVDDADAAAQRTTLGLAAGGAGDIWVEKAGDTMTGDLIVPDEAYDATSWNGSLEVPTKNAIRDKIETMGGGVTLEDVYDALGNSVLVAGNNIDITHDDGLDTITIAVETLTLADVSDVTASTAEVNVLDGIPATLTATELGYVDGVTSAIQTQLDGKADLTGDTFTGQIISQTGDGEGLSLERYSTGSAGPSLRLRKSDTASLGAHALVDNGERIGQLVWQGSDGTDWRDGARIEAYINGSPGASDMPTDLVLSTTPDATATSTEKVRIGSASVVINDTAADYDTVIKGDTDATLLYVDAGADSVAIGNSAPTSWFDLKAGTTARAPLRIPSGTNLTTPVAGVVEYDGAVFYGTQNTTSDRSILNGWHEFRLTSNGAAIGAAIADVFGANSSINLPASTNWHLEAYLYFLKSTGGTVTVTVTNSAANYTNYSAWLEIDAVGGGTGFQALTRANIHNTTTAANAFPATASVTTATNHLYILGATFQMNAAGNIRIRFTESAGTVTPLANSFYRIRRMPGNTGDFVA